MVQAKENQPRRLKQLAIFLGIAEAIRQSVASVELYAQDPAFTRADEQLLASLGIKVLRTSSLSDLGEAGAIIDSSTLVYSPFLTVDAYELLLSGKKAANLVIGDDFEALQQKWPKHSAEKHQVDELVKSSVTKYQRRIVKGAGFWDIEDKSFPLALYRLEDKRIEHRSRL